MGQVLTIMIFVALGINVVRLIRRPTWRLLFSFPFWVYLAWGHLGPGETNRWVAGGLFLLLLLGYGVLWSRSGGWRNDESEDGEGLEGDCEDEDLEFRLEVEPVGPNWRDSFPPEKEVFARLERMRSARLLRYLDENPSKVYSPHLLQGGGLTEECANRLRLNVDEYFSGSRGIKDLVKSLDLLNALEPGAEYDALERFLTTVSKEQEKRDLRELLVGMTWSRHCPQGEVPAELAEALEARFAEGDEDTREAILRWKMRNEAVDREAEVLRLDDYSPLFISQILSSKVFVRNQRALLTSIVDRFVIKDDSSYSKEETRTVANVASALRRRELSVGSEDFTQIASAFLTEVLERVPLVVFNDHEWRRTWENFCLNVETPEAQALKRRVISFEDDAASARYGAEKGDGEEIRDHALASIVDDSIAGLAGEFPEESVRLIMERFDGRRLMNRVGEMAKRHELFRQLILEAFQSQYRREAGDQMSKHWLERSLLSLSTPEDLKFLMERFEQVEMGTLTRLAWETVGVSSLEAARELQSRGLIPQGELSGDDDDVDLENCLIYLCHSQLVSISSDSDQRPPPYDEAIRDLAKISQGGFPAERVRLRIIPTNEPNGWDRIEVSWFLLEKRFSFQVDYVGDSLFVFWLFRAVNESLENIGSSKRFLAFGDGSIISYFVFGDPEEWRKAGEEFCLRLYTMPEFDGISDEDFCEAMLKKVSGFVARRGDSEGFSNT